MDEVIPADFREVMLPYAMLKHPDRTWTFLNRRYKPVGLATYQHCDYEDSKYRLRLKGLGAATLKKLDIRGTGIPDDEGMIWLYKDRTNPSLSRENFKSYLDKFRLLMSLQHTYR